MLSKVKICSLALIAAIPALAKANDSSAETGTNDSQSGISGIVLQHCIPVDGQEKCFLQVAVNKKSTFFAKKADRDSLLLSNAVSRLNVKLNVVSDEKYEDVAKFSVVNNRIESEESDDLQDGTENGKYGGNPENWADGPHVAEVEKLKQARLEKITKQLGDCMHDAENRSMVIHFVELGLWLSGLDSLILPVEILNQIRAKVAKGLCEEDAQKMRDALSSRTYENTGWETAGEGYPGLYDHIA